MEYFFLIFSLIFTGNFVLSKLLGICPLVRVSKTKYEHIKIGTIVIFVMTVASITTWFVEKYFLSANKANIFYRIFGGDLLNYDLTYLRTLVYIIIIVTLFRLIELFLLQLLPSVYEAIGNYFQMVVLNCIVLGVTLLNVDLSMSLNQSGFLLSFIQGFAGGLGFLFILIIINGINEKLMINTSLPKSLRGIPIILICLAIIGLAFSGFKGIGN